MSSATLTHPNEAARNQASERELTMGQAMLILSREERFMATVSVMNTLLIHKGIYTQEEFDAIFVRWAKAQLSRPRTQRPGWRSIFSRLFGR
jgi:hypothetical protein